MTGWDFSKLAGRIIEEPMPWDFKQIVIQNIRKSESLLDLGTGGGEFLSSLAPLPKNTFCTEGYRQNVTVARYRLKPLGVEVVCNFCDDNNIPSQRGALCFRGESLDLIMDRHESFIASEVFRALRKGGIFLTQQVGTGNLIDLNELLGANVPDAEWNIKECVKQIEAVGLEIIEYADAKLKTTFKDVEAIACYLLSVPWQVPDFSVDRYLRALRKIHDSIEKNGPVEATSTRFFVSAKRPR